MALHKRTHEWGRWVGTAHDLEHLAQSSIEAIPEDRRHENGIYFTVERKGTEDRFVAPSEFAQFVETHRRKVLKMSTHVMSMRTWAHVTPGATAEEYSVAIYWRRDLRTFGGVTLVVESTDETWADGVFQRFRRDIAEHANGRKHGAYATWGIPGFEVLAEGEHVAWKTRLLRFRWLGVTVGAALITGVVGLLLRAAFG